jgi:hypothetical protein
MGYEDVELDDYMCDGDDTIIDYRVDTDYLYQ